MLYLITGMVLLLQVGMAFKWPIDATLPAGKYFTFSERYMFASKQGPVLMDNGDSFIKVQLHFDVYDITNHTASIVMAVFAADEDHHDSSLEGLCDGFSPSAAGDWAKDVDTVTFLTEFQGQVHFNMPFGGTPGASSNTSYYHRTAKVDYSYKVRNELWHNVVFVLCTQSFYRGSGFTALPIAPPPVQSSVSTVHTEVLGMQPLSTLHTVARSMHSTQPSGAMRHSVHSIPSHAVQTNTPQTAVHADATNSYENKYAPKAVMTGTIAFHNPYGYIPAELYGMLPFQLARMLAYIFFGMFFVGHYLAHRDTTLNLHNAFLLIFLFALLESVLWFASYQYLNIDGVPYCCPFSPLVVASLVFQCVRQTLSRCLLLVVCLGYGIVRPKLLHSEWIAVSVITTLYLLCTLISQGAVILYANQSHNYTSTSTLLPYKIPEMFLDVIFLTWIYLAIGSTIRILTEFNQTVKLNMYKQLVSIIGVFVILFTTVTFFFMIDAQVTAFLPWQTAWLEQVIWESLNFAVLAAVCIVCRPTANSQLLSYASQLPTEDPDMYDSDEEHGIELPGPWSSNRDYIYDDLDKDDAYDSDSMEHSTHGNKHSGSSGSGNGKEREIVLGDYQKANKEYQQQQTSNNPMYRSGRPSLSKYSPTNANKQNKTNYTSYDLPEASDEEYGLEQDDL